MKYSRLGQTDIEVSELAFGSLTMSPLGAGMPAAEAAAVLTYAIDAGVNFIDTAQLYDNYEYLRMGLAAARRDACVASKTYAYEKKTAFEAVEQARLGLNRDVVDVFMLHEQESEHTLRGHAAALDELVRLKDLGVLRAVGVSTHCVACVRAAARMPEIDVIHPLINRAGLGIADGRREDMEAAVADAWRAGKGIYTMKALGGGNLFFDASACLEYAFGFPYKHAVCIGMQSRDEVDANLEFCETGAFSQTAAAALSQKRRRLSIDGWCTGCGACQRRCKNGGIVVVDGRATPTDSCVLCGYCASVCPEWAIKVL